MQTGLQANTQYKVLVDVQDKVGHIASNTRNIYTKAAVPSLGVNNATSYTLDISTTDNNPSTTQYQISVNNGAQYVTQEGNSTSTPVWIALANKKITVKGLNPSTTYTFQAKARNTENVETNVSPSVSGTTLIKPPAAPENLIATATNNQITVSWGASATATGYDIQVDGKTIDVGTSRTYTQTLLNPNTPHTYQVRASNDGGPGAWSAQITKSTLPTSPDIPVNVVAVPQSTSITVTWGNVPFATGYDIEVDGALVTNGPTTNYVHSSLSPGTHHSYRVRSINPGGKSDWSVMVSATTAQVTSPVPANLTATPSKNEITLAWEAVNGATGYEIEVDGVRIDNNTKTTYTHKNLASGSQHMYRVRSKKNGVISDWSAAVVAETLSDLFGTPTGLRADANDTSIVLSWNSVADATGYDIEADGVALDNGTKSTANISGLLPGSTHSFRVRARGSSTNSDWSEPVQVATLDLPTPVILNAVSSETAIQLSWQNTTAAAATFELEADGSIIPDIKESTYTYEGLTSGTQHVFRVRAKNEDGISNWSKPVTKSTLFGVTNAPAGLLALMKETSATLVWQGMDGAVSYDIYVDGKVIECISETKYIHTGLLPGSQHTYKVRANNDTGKSKWSGIITVMTDPEGPSVPSNITASPSTSRVLVSWDQVTCAEGYEIEVDGVVLDVGNTKNYLHNGLSPDTQHKYRVRSKNSSAFSQWSDFITVITNSSTMTYNVGCMANEEFNLVFSATDIQDIGQYTFTISYDPNELEVTDLCGLTSRIDNSAGYITGTDIQIVQYVPGTIVFNKSGTAQSYQVWSGVVNTVRLKSLVEGQVNVTYSFQ